MIPTLLDNISQLDGFELPVYTLDRTEVALVEFNPYHDHRGRFTSRHGPFALPPADAMAALAAGEQPSIVPADMDEFMGLALERSDHPDLTELKVEGTLKFGDDGLGLARKDMPQLPEDRRQAYYDHLRDRGISVTPGEISPQALKPMQKAISAKKAAEIHAAMKDGSFREENRIAISNDNYVLDGHHRWGASTALSFSNPDTKIDFDKIDLPAKDLLEDARSWTTEQGIATKVLGEEAVLAEHYPHKTGSPQSVHGGVRSGRSAGLTASLTKVEGGIRHFDGGEIGVVLDKDGNEVWRSQQMGDPDGPGPRRAGLSVPPDAYKHFKGNVFTHNHPAMGDPADLIKAHDTFSPDDIMSATGMGVAEVRMVNPFATHSLRPGPGGWGSPYEIDSAARNIGFKMQLDSMLGGAPPPSRIEFTKELASAMGWKYEVTDA